MRVQRQGFRNDVEEEDQIPSKDFVAIIRTPPLLDVRKSIIEEF